MELEPSSKSGASSMLPLGIGLLGLVIGIVALIMSFSNSGKLTPLIGLDTTVVAATKNASDAKSVAEGLDGKVNDLTSRIGQLQAAAQDAFTKQQAEIDAIKTQATARTTSTSSSKSGTTAAGDQKTTVGPNGGTYPVESNDNFTKIATKFGVTVKELEAANPGVDSSRLKVGQKLTIPPHSAGTSTRGTGRSGTSAPTAPAPSGTGAPATAVTP